MMEMRFGKAVVESPRQLSGNEAKMMARSADAVRAMHPGISASALSLALESSLSAILCNDGHWSEMARNMLSRVSHAKEGKERTAEMLSYEGMVIGMVEVMDIRYDMHDGRAIARAIDDATRPDGFEMLDGFISYSNAWKIIRRAYSGNAEGESGKVG